jgi:predicted MFS family arabinose efflux permease|tara:strand:- start:119 stop:1330 length:1212 start_codon:yes stop_codon:yes gene_type:complete
MGMSVRQSRKMWFLVAIGGLIALLGLGIRADFGLFLAPMSADLGWGREVFALAIAIQNLIWGLGQPVAGMIADRFGTARVLALGGLLYGLGVYGMAQASSPSMLYMTGGLLVGLGMSGASFSLVLAALGRMVPERHRTLAFGLTTAAGSMGQFLLVPLGQKFLEAYGWSTALMLLAVIVALIIPLSTAMRGRAEEVAGAVKQSMGEAMREAGRHSGYLYLTAGFFVCGFHVAFIATHLPAYITDRGLSAEIGAWSLATIGLFNVFGAILAGVLGNRFQKKNILSLIYLARAVIIALFVLLPIGPTTVLLFSAAIGLTWLSTVPLTSGIVAQVFGPRYMATLFGFVFLSHQFGSFLGVWLGGYLFDQTGSYDMVWWLGVALGLFAALVHLPINERPATRLAAAE